MKHIYCCMWNCPCSGIIAAFVSCANSWNERNDDDDEKKSTSQVPCVRWKLQANHSFVTYVYMFASPYQHIIITIIIIAINVSVVGGRSCGVAVSSTMMFILITLSEHEYFPVTHSIFSPFSRPRSHVQYLCVRCLCGVEHIQFWASMISLRILNLYRYRSFIIRNVYNWYFPQKNIDGYTTHGHTNTFGIVVRLRAVPNGNVCARARALKFLSRAESIRWACKTQAIGESKATHLSPQPWRDSFFLFFFWSVIILIT